ncbi:hypothetical protein AOZ06_26525 [Kibdelosporangium phytohabitans]|uniref:Uncharacterized protein n=1 Tax=Kibdelosporangium phytohabitans TaxID=860235 RepID=A0A0N9HS04_9PSEU|nr:hypothetical protein AOZ06_26525 [Kibdelosporangium phytohabitans]
MVPSQVTPFRLNDTGLPLVPEKVPLKPGDTLAPVGTDPFQAVSRAVTPLPWWVNSAFQPCRTCWSPGNSHSRVQPPDTGSPRLVTVTVAPKPVLHWLVMV